MFKQIFYIVFYYFILLGNCYAKDKMDAFPSWLLEKAHGNTSQIREKTADGKKYYMIISKCCDQFNPVFDEEGIQVCSLGGFTGRGDGKCPKFDAEK